MAKELWGAETTEVVPPKHSLHGMVPPQAGTLRPALVPSASPDLLPRASTPNNATDFNTESPFAAAEIGRIINVQGCSAQVEALSIPDKRPAEIGALVTIRTRSTEIISVISSLSIERSPQGEFLLVDLVLVGALEKKENRRYFRRGVADFPCIGDNVYFSSADEIACVYVQAGVTSLDVGTLYHDPSIRARLIADDLFSKHFCIVGTTGSGKSCALTSILQRALDANHYAHIVILDLHGEYHHAFGDRAEVISAHNLHLPYWLLNFQELRSVITTRDEYHEAQTEILADALAAAKKRFLEFTSGRVRSRLLDVTTSLVDSPTPFRLSDVLSFIDEQIGRLERPYPAPAYRRLKNRIDTLTNDPRYSFMFNSANVEDSMVDVLARLFRIPNNGRPITVLELAAVPEEILDVVVLLISRLTFDLAVWSNGRLPVLLVCEEAHRYISRDDRKEFSSAREALSRIAKEGRKYGISLALLTQRPSELDTTVLSQCGTVIAMRLSTEADQKIMRSNAHDSTFGILEYLPLLADREAVVLGRGTPMPMRIRFQDLPLSCLPDKSSGQFMQRWANPNMDRSELEATVARWRGRGTPS